MTACQEEHLGPGARPKSEDRSKDGAKRALAAEVGGGHNRARNRAKDRAACLLSSLRASLPPLDGRRCSTNGHATATNHLPLTARGLFYPELCFE